MSESAKEQMDSLMGIGGQSPEQPVDWEAKYRELEKELQSNRVEHGRLKKTNEELESARRELDELRMAKRSEELDGSLTDDERAAIPEEILVAAKKLVSSGMERMKQENEVRFRSLEDSRRERDAESQNANLEAFKRMTEERFPGFLNSIGPGGDKQQYWQQYLKFNGASVSSAYTAGDFESFAYHVEKFYSEQLGIPVPSASQYGSAASDPRNAAGGYGGGHSSGRVYTVSEFNSLFDQKEEARDRGDYAEVKRLTDEINRAQAEGRVK